MNYSNKKNKHITIIALIIASIQLINSCKAQESANSKEIEESTSDKWQNGYIIKRETQDTVYGLIKKNMVMGFVEWIDFKTNNEDKKKPYRGDSVILFKYDNEVYRHFNCCGFMERISTGTINMYKGTVRGYGTVYNCYVFKKKELEAKMISNEYTKPLSGGVLKNKIKKNLEDYINDNNELYTEFQKEDFKYDDLKSLIDRYNASIKSN